MFLKQLELSLFGLITNEDSKITRFKNFLSNKKTYQKVGLNNRYRFYFVSNILIGKIHRLEVTKPPSQTVPRRNFKD